MSEYPGPTGRSDCATRICSESSLANCALPFSAVSSRSSEVKWVEIDRDQSTAQIHYESGRIELSDILHRLAVGHSRSYSPDATTLSDGIVPSDLSGSASTDQDPSVWQDPHDLGHRP